MRIEEYVVSFYMFSSFPCNTLSSSVRFATAVPLKTQPMYSFKKIYDKCSFIIYLFPVFCFCPFMSLFILSLRRPSSLRCTICVFLHLWFCNHVYFKEKLYSCYEHYLSATSYYRRAFAERRTLHGH